MKPFYLSAICLACLQSSGSAFAININAPTGAITNFPSRLDSMVQPLQKTIEKTTEQKLQPLDRLSATADTLVEPVLELSRQLAQDLPKQLPILDADGKAVFVDVEVEHGWRAVEREWLVMIEDKDLPALQPLEILEKTRFEQLAMTLVRFKATPELDSLAALQKLLPAAIYEQMDRNHIYTAQNHNDDNNITVNVKRNAVCKLPLTLGMIDTAINSNHPAFTKNKKHTKIISQDFLNESLVAPDVHGTAVASLFIGKTKQLQPLLPKATLYSASVFFSRNEYSQGATMLNLVRALNWLAGQKLSVINMSLAGPANQILARVVEKMLANGYVIVAAAGNQGPAAPALFPAAYPGVIAVTAVDKEQKNYRWANQGKYISFAALGVAVLTARSAGGEANESGTSMAAPVVSALMACELAQKQSSPAQALADLILKAVDLGEIGRDAVFGYGAL
ncbi:MAG: S8 family serine peptidase [Pseudomonadota bacterium]